MKRLICLAIAALLLLSLAVPVFAEGTINNGGNSEVYFSAAEYSIRATSKMTGKYPAGYEKTKFTIKAIPMDKDTPAFAKPEAIVADGEYATWKQMAFDPATFTFLVVQEQGEDSRIAYDDTVYRVSIDISTDASGNIAASESITNTKTNQKTAEIVFENTYVFPETTTTVTTTAPAKQPDKPHTGDDTMQGARIAAIIGLSVLAVGAVVVLVTTRKKDDKEPEKNENKPQM